ncbi:unnamed protein product [Linum trigynum]|uniref:Cystatin domain-containing protein n=1 Tax=Linum trigynum TaxID=586398 RepID=A0AAV2EJ16_9ROSI
MSSSNLLFAAAALLALFFISAAEATVPVSWLPFKNLKAPKVTAIAQFAVKEYNKFHPDRPPLTLVSIDSGEYLKADGENYHLYITAADRYGPGKYQTFVFEYPAGNWDLTSFVRMDRG